MTTAIIVNYHTRRFLSGLLEVLDAEKEIDRVVIVDNSREPNLDAEIEKFNGVSLIVPQKNLGFGAAVNLAAREYASEFYLIINPDTLPIPGFVGKLLNGLYTSDAMIAGPRFYWDELKHFRLPPALGESWLSRITFAMAETSPVDAAVGMTGWVTHHDWFWKQDSVFPETFLSGGCLLIKNDKDFFRNGEIFDDRFFLYFEETDLCLRANLENKGVVCVPDAEVIHFWDQSPSEMKNTYMAQSHEKYYEKHYGRAGVELIGFNELEKPQWKISDLGDNSSSPVFKTRDGDYPGQLYFEFGLSPVFIPFAQAEIQDAEFRIPGPVWDNLKPGEYYSRFRTSFNKVIASWKWRKI